jgi:hypothetical protein
MVNFNAHLRSLIHRSIENLTQIESTLQFLPENARTKVALFDLRELIKVCDKYLSNSDKINADDFRLDQHMVRFLDSIYQNNFGITNNIESFENVRKIIQTQFQIIEEINKTTIELKKHSH